MCNWPDCKEKGEYDMEVCSETNEDKVFDVVFCRKHYIETMFYNSMNPEDEGVELTDEEKKEWKIEQSNTK